MTEKSETDFWIFSRFCSSLMLSLEILPQCAGLILVRSALNSLSPSSPTSIKLLQSLLDGVIDIPHPSPTFGMLLKCSRRLLKNCPRAQSFWPSRPRSSVSVC
eukprot:GABV01012560.1.p1 GENE.GABV01012560.1~~GABV01012560.1.p1  ORF type:complete len:103 (+),score=18.25 GABV01012560.1:97-405(+)